MFLSFVYNPSLVSVFACYILYTIVDKTKKRYQGEFRMSEKENVSFTNRICS